VPGLVIPAGTGPARVTVEFGHHDVHPDTRQPLRKWIAQVARADWDPVSRAWVVTGFRVADPAGLLAEAGFRLSGYARDHLERHFTADASSPGRGIPSWFGRAGGIKLFPYQAEGATLVASGRTLLGDEPGIGKTLQALAAFAAVGAKRIVILCPPLVIAHWGREVRRSGLAAPGGSAYPGASSGEPVVMVVAGKKPPAELPASGVVITGDSLLASRRGLQNQLICWQPDGMVYDEAHRAKTWSSRRSQAARELAAAVRSNSLPDGRPGLTIAATGTPMFASPAELPGVLDIAGKLDGFGGHRKFLTRYSRQNHFKAWVPRMDRLPELRRKLEDLWVRRTKSQVLPDLPEKLYFEVPVDASGSKAYRDAYREVRDAVDAWLAGLAKRRLFPPDAETIDEFASGNLGLVSRLRRAAGIVKIPAAVEWVTAHLDGNPVDVETGAYPRPLIVWTHHGEVRDALLESLADAGLADPARVRACAGPVRVIEGDTKLSDRNQVEQDFQVGRVALLIASIHAAGVGITLTRSSDVLFAETDWTPAVVTQAIDRCHRVGASATHLNIGTMIAVGTIDEQVHKALSHKGRVLDSAVGGDNIVTEFRPGGQAATARRILTRLIAERIQACGAKRASPRAGGQRHAA
jgi:hypothetical protein